MSLTRRRFVAASLATLAAPSFAAAAPLAPPPEHVPWLKDVQQPPVPPVSQPGASALSPLLLDADGKPITDLAGWKRRRAEIEGKWRAFLNPIDLPRGEVNLRIIEEDRRDGVIRQLIEYDNEPGQRLQAYLLKPLDANDTRKLAAVVVLHSTNAETIRQGAGLGAQPEKAFGLMLARRGCIAICPMNFLWAEPPDGTGSTVYQKRTDTVLQRHPGTLGMSKMLYDAQRAVDVLVSLPGVDAKRIGCVGHSLGAKEALYLPAFDPRVTAAVSSEGGIGIKFSNWHDRWYLGPAVKEPGFKLDHHELLALIAPRPFLLVGGDSADGDKSWPYIQAAMPVYELHGKPAALGLLNHKKGHSVPPEAEKKIIDWLVSYLSVPV